MRKTESVKDRMFSILSVILAVFTVVVAVSCQSGRLSESGDAATYVFVPGGGHGAWCYEPVIDLIEANGHRAYAVSLPGVGERSSELTAETGLEDHIEAVVDFILQNDLKDVILVGHSYGGMVITGTADRLPEMIRVLVYLDAVHPKNGKNLIEAQPLVRHVPIVGNPVVMDGIEVNLVPGRETLDFLGLTDEDDVAFAKDKLTPHPYKSFTDKLVLQDPNVMDTVGKMDIYTGKTLDGLLKMHIVTSEEAQNSMVIDTGHDLMITEPELTTQMLLKAAELH